MIADSWVWSTTRRKAANRFPQRTLGLLTVVLFMLGLSTFNLGDWGRYYKCANVAFLSGQNPYGCTNYYNTPVSFYFQAPFTMLGAPWDALAWSLFTTTCTCLAIGLLLHGFKMLEHRSMALIALLVLCPFTLFLILFQQGTAGVLLIEAAMLWLIRNRRYGGAAAVLALAAFKPHLMLVLLPLLAPLPRRLQAACVGAGVAALGLLSWPYLGAFQASILHALSTPPAEHSSIAARELIRYFGTGPVWQTLGYLLLVPPFIYFCRQAYLLFRRRTLDMVLVAKMLPAGLLFLPYNRAYDWVLVLPSYLVLWELAGRRWTPLLRGNVVVAMLALPVSVGSYLIAWTPFYAHLPISINPLPLILLIYTLERVTRQAHRTLLWSPVHQQGLAANVTSVIKRPKVSTHPLDIAAAVLYNHQAVRESSREKGLVRLR